MSHTSPTPARPRRYLVTGGGGFLGHEIVQQLLARGDRVRSVSRGHYPQLEEAGVEHIQGDLAEPGVAEKALDGVEAVFHVAAKAGVWGRYRDYVRANLTATRRVLEACQALQVGRLIYTSSPSVVFAMRDEAQLEESAPYPRRFYTHYSKTKAAAERLVLEANGPQLATVSLRPHLIVGPGDPHLVPRLIERANQGALKQVGPGENQADLTDVEDAARAHLLAEDKLREAGSGAGCAGQAYFITQGDSVNLWSWIRELLATLEQPAPGSFVPYKLAYAAGALLEAGYWLLGLRQREPKMTRFLAAQLAKTHTYSIEAAQRDLGYTPSRSMSEVTARIVEWWRERSTTPAG